MITQIRNSIFTKVLWGVMGLFMLNISVDLADINPENIPENLSFNDQESIVEIVVEKVLGYEDAFKEYDDNDNENQSKKTTVKIDFTTHYWKEIILSHGIRPDVNRKFPNYQNSLENRVDSLDSPPPQI